MTQLRFDPGAREAFWQAIRPLEGYPQQEDVRLRWMVFESGAVWHLPDYLMQAGADPARPLLVVMDKTRMQRAGEDLKPLVLRTVRQAGWSPEIVIASPDGTGQVHTDWMQIDRVRSRLKAGCAVLSVGSGTITDIAKHAC